MSLVSSVQQSTESQFRWWIRCAKRKRHVNYCKRSKT